MRPGAFISPQVYYEADVQGLENDNPIKHDSLASIDASRITERCKKLASLFALATTVNPRRGSRSDVAMLQNI